MEQGGWRYNLSLLNSIVPTGQVGYSSSGWVRS